MNLRRRIGQWGLLIGITLWPWLTMGQKAAEMEEAARVVNRYLALTDLSQLAMDSMLIVETEVTLHGSTDTFLMKRWFAQPQMQRVEVWHSGQLTAALCTNGSNRFREYKPMLGYWEDTPPATFHEHLSGYDLHGPLHNWRERACQLTYKGEVLAKDSVKLLAVKVEAPGRYTRDYLFEPSGLLVVILENGEMLNSTDYRHSSEARIEWKIIHEYQYLKPLLLPKQESFMRQGQLTVLTSHAHIAPRHNLIFNQD